MQGSWGGVAVVQCTAEMRVAQAKTQTVWTVIRGSMERNSWLCGAEHVMSHVTSSRHSVGWVQGGGRECALDMQALT